MLGDLLNKSILNKEYFSKVESEKLKNRLNEIKSSEASKLVKEMLEDIEAILVVVASKSLISGIDNN